jgi:hypothetical protein
MSDNPLYICKRTPGPIAIDGMLDEPGWVAADRFDLVKTDTNEQPRLPTVVRALWDDTYLYVGFECTDNDIWSNMTEHDAPLWEEEVVEIFLDPAGIGTAYFEMVVNPLNTLTDVFVINLGSRKRVFQPLREWECEGIQHAVSVDGDPQDPESIDHSWSVEFAIPFEQLVTAPNIPPKNGDTWRGNFYRIEQNNEGDEYTAWSPTGEINYHVPGVFGTIVFSNEVAG